VGLFYTPDRHGEIYAKEGIYAQVVPQATQCEFVPKAIIQQNAIDYNP